MPTARFNPKNSDEEAEVKRIADELYEMLQAGEILDLSSLDGVLRMTVMRTTKERYYCRVLIFDGTRGHYRFIHNYEEQPTIEPVEKMARQSIEKFEAMIHNRLGVPYRTDMTTLLYLTDSYNQAFESQIVDVDIPFRGVLLNQTAFFPGGGGQQADRGELVCNGISYPVLSVHKNLAGVWHILGSEQPLPSLNSTVQGQLDWARRYAIMRTHTAMHILCGVVFRDYGALVTGGDMEPLKGRMDFEFESMSGDLVRVIEEAVNAEVAAARPVRIQILPREEAFQIPDLIRTKINLLPEEIREIRTVELVGLDLQADGGTHVRNTAEVGRLRIVDYKSKGRINKRIYVELDEN